MWGVLVLVGLGALYLYAKGKAPGAPPGVEGPAPGLPAVQKLVSAGALGPEALYFPDPGGGFPGPIVQAIVAGAPVTLYGDLEDPAGIQNVSVNIGDVGYGMSFGGWDTTPGANAPTLAVLEARIAADPNDAVAIGELAVMKSLGLT